MYEKKLKELGFTAGEAKVYETLLVLGPTTVGPVVKKAKVAYSNIYEILNRLLDKGLVSFVVKSKTKYFQAEDLDRIGEYLDLQEKELLKKKESFSELKDKLVKLKGFAMKEEEAEVFVGEKGLMTAYEKLLKFANKKDEGYFFFVYDKESYVRSEQFYVKSWHLMRKYGNKWKGISNKEFKSVGLVKKYPSFIKQKFVSFPGPGNIDVLGDRVLITTWSVKPVGVLIHSKEVADSYRKYFLSVWG